jgi:hypothetical protein
MSSDEKMAGVVEHIDNKPEALIVDPEKAPVVEFDRFGAHAKTDPKEIALVRKLDMFIMVC